MVNIFIALCLFILVIWISKKFYVSVDAAENPDKYDIVTDPKKIQRDIAIVFEYLKRWKREGSITGQEYEIFADLCLQEYQKTRSTNSENSEKKGMR